MDYNTFDSICYQLGKLKNTKDKSTATTILNEWFNCVPRECMYTVMRLILPTCDTRVYKIKYTTLAKLIGKYFCLSKQDTHTLVNWNKPNSYQKVNDFGMLAYNICKKWSDNTNRNDITIQQVDMWLTLLTENDDILNTILSKLSLVQLLWFCNIVLKQVKIGVGMNTIIKAYHCDAPSYWSINRNLEEMCNELIDPNKRFDVYNVHWGANISPVLCELTTFDKILLKGHVYAETKYDGERMMLHYGFSQEYADKNFNVPEYICYSRNGKVVDYTLDFKTAFSSFTNCIVDGEIVLVDKNGNIIPKEKIGTKKDECTFLYIVFDIIFVNDKSICMQTIEERMKYLEQIRTTSDIQVCEKIKCTTKSEILSCFTRAIETKQEGIVIKYADTTYEVGARKKDLWLKMKPDYEDSISDDLDLVILGGYYSEGSTQTISTFLVGYLDKINGQFKSVTKVGNGFTQQMYNTIYKKIGIDNGNAFPLQNANGLNIILGNDKPDVLFNPMKSMVIQVRATSVTPSNSTGSKFNLRFPRCTGLRLDKSVTDTTIPKLSKEIRVIKDTQPKVPAWKQREYAWWRYQLVDKSTLVQLDRLFTGKTFHVAVPTAEQKHHLEKLILEHGGDVWQNGYGTDYIIAPELTKFLESGYAQKPRIVKLSNKKVLLRDHDIVKPEWVEQCIKQLQILPLTKDNSVYIRGSYT